MKNFASHSLSAKALSLLLAAGFALSMPLTAFAQGTEFAPAEEQPAAVQQTPETAAEPAPAPAAEETPAPTPTSAPTEEPVTVPNNTYLTPDVQETETFITVSLYQNGEFPASDLASTPMLMSDELSDVAGARAAILAALERRDTTINIYSYGILTAEMGNIYRSIVNENPRLFYCTGGLSYYHTTSGVVTTIKPVYSSGYTDADIAAYEARVQQILDETIRPGMTTLQKYLALHEYLALHTEYDLTYSNHNAYHALVEGVAVCQGYSLAYRDLLNRLDITSGLVSSDAANHMWNTVELDGKWYCIDVTWDDPVPDRVGYVRHEYFLKSLAALIADEPSKADAIWDAGDGCTDTRYDTGAYWEPMDAAIYSYGNTAIYIDEKVAYPRKVKLVQRDLSSGTETTLAETDGLWSAGGAGLSWPGVYSYLSYYDQKYFFNSPDAVYCYDPAAPGAPQKVYTNTDTTKQIYGFVLRDGQASIVKSALSAGPNGTPTKLDITLDYTPTPTGLPIDAANFPDENFRAYVKANFDTNGDSLLSNVEIQNAKEIVLHDGAIVSVKGIEHLPDLTKLDCSGNKIAELDVSGNTKLTILNCARNQLTELDVGGNTKLDELYCTQNKLTQLDVSKNVSLDYLDCEDNAITALDVSANTSLETLYADNNQISTLDLSENKDLEWLYFENNKLQEIDLSQNDYLAGLGCAGNKLTELNLEGLTRLQRLSCGGNKIETLDVSSCTNLTTLYCLSTSLTSLDLQNTKVSLLEGAGVGTALAEKRGTTWQIDMKTVVGAANIGRVSTSGSYGTYDQTTGVVTFDEKPTGWTYRYDTKTPGTTTYRYFPVTLSNLTYLDNSGLPIDAANFPDENFRAYVAENFDADADGCLSDAEREAVTTISVQNKSVSDLTGLANFPNLTTLNCFNNNLTALDVSENTALVKLDCGTNQLTALDVSHNPALQVLCCEENQLTALDVTANPALTMLVCRQNQLTVLDVSKNTALATLNCGENQLTALDVSKNTALLDLVCHENNLTALDVSKNTELAWLNFRDNQVSTLDVSKNTKLVNLCCTSNVLTALDVTASPNLYNLECHENELSTLKVNGLGKLLYLHADSNKLTALDLTGCTKLERIYVCENELTTLDVTALPALTILICNDNHLPVLDLSNNPALQSQDGIFCRVTNQTITADANLVGEEWQVDLNTIAGLDAAKVTVTPAANGYPTCTDGVVTLCAKDGDPRAAFSYVYATGSTLEEASRMKVTVTPNVIAGPLDPADLPAKTSAATLLQDMPDGTTVERADGTPVGETENVGTGCVVTWPDNTKETVVVYGDVTGEGTINVGDLSAIRRCILGTRTVEGAYLKAGTPISENPRSPTLRDLSRLRCYILGTEDSMRG